MHSLQILLTSLERIINGNIQISFILTIRSTSKFSINHFVALNSTQKKEGEMYVYDNWFLKIKYCLFPMCIFSVRTGTKSNRFMTSFKTDIKPCYKSMNEIISCSTKFNVCDEGEIGDGAGIEIEVEDSVRICDD